MTNDFEIKVSSNIEGQFTNVFKPLLIKQNKRLILDLKIKSWDYYIYLLKSFKLAQKVNFIFSNNLSYQNMFHSCTLKLTTLQNYKDFAFFTQQIINTTKLKSKIPLNK